MSDPDLGFDLPEPARPSRTRVVVTLLVVAVVLVGIFLVVWIPRRKAKAELVRTTQASEGAALRVQVVAPVAKSSDRKLTLPGSVQALEETTVHPRSSGYVSKWLVDMGDAVEADAVLAEIDTPEIDQQLDQARAQLAQAEAGLVQATANRELSKTNLGRYEKLAPSGVASEQEVDEKRARAQVDEANVQVARANIEAQRANVRRLAQMKSWGRVTAPFSGKVSARLVERGALVSPTTPLFRISAVDPVRVYVRIPQNVAPAVQTDTSATVTVREYPGRTFEGKLARSAGTLDSQSRTMNVEIRVPNPKGELIAGMYAQVALELPIAHRVYEVPATALTTDAKGVRVAVIDADNRVRLRPVVIERDTGATIEIASGLEESDRVAKLGSVDLVEDRLVEIVP